MLALLLTTLSVVLVMPVFLRQQYLTRYTELQQEQAALRAAMHSAVDYALEILAQDARLSTVDHLGEIWCMSRLALPAAGPAGADAPGHALVLSITDAQARFNLANLSQNGVTDPREVAAFEKLLGLLHLAPALAAPIAAMLAASQAPVRMGGAPLRPASSMVAPAELADLLVLPGVTAQLLAALDAHVVLLPEATPVNLNTADELVLAARFPAMSLEQARQVVQLRSPAYFRDPLDFMARAQGLGIGEPLVNVSVASSYFLVRLDLGQGGAGRRIEALIARGGGQARLLSQHQD